MSTTSTRAPRVENSEKLLLSAEAPEIYAAAAGMRPHIGAYDELPLIDGKLRMAPASATYAVTRDGGGTEVTLTGTTVDGHSCAVRVNGFYPYMYVRICDLDPYQLVGELDATLLAMMAFEGEHRPYTPEYLTMQRYVVGYEPCRQTDGKINWVPFTGRAEGRSIRPVVGWELVDGTLLRGSGDQRGYRGLESERFIKIYFYLPSLVPKAKQILHGVYNVDGAERQAQRLSDGRSMMQERLAEEASDLNALKEAEKEKKQGSRGKEFGRYRHLDKFIKSWVPHGDTGEGDGEESSDDEDGDAIDDVAAVEVVDEPAESTAAADEMVPEEAKTLPIDAYEPELAEESLLQRPAGADADDKTPAEDEVSPVDQFIDRACRALNEARGPHVTSSYLNRLGPQCVLTVCEADIDFILRFAIDAGFSYNQFIEIDMQRTLDDGNCHERRVGPFDACIRESRWCPPDTPPLIEPRVRVARRAANRECTSDTQIEIYCDFHHLALSPDRALQRQVPRTVQLSVDCEMETHGTFPRPESEKVLQIGCVIPLPDGRHREIGFTIGQVARGPGEWVVKDEATAARKRKHITIEEDGGAAEAHVPRDAVYVRTLAADVESEHILCFPSEALMLLGFGTFVRTLSPDIIISFNGDNFDMPYLLERAKQLGVGDEFARAWGVSHRDQKLKVRDRTYGSTAIGKHEYKEVTASGRLFYDLFQYLKRNPMIKLRSYSLNAVALEYVQMEKENVAYSEIDKLQQTPDGRRKLLTYCIRDALLPVLVDRKKTILQELLEKSRGTGVPIEYLLKRGMQIQCKTYLYRKSRIGMLVPEMARGMPGITDAGRRRRCFWYTRTDAERRVEMRGEKFGGATVLNPKRGLHEEPVVTLDFRALYPTIMSAGNYCLSTLLAPNFDAHADAFFAHLVATGQRKWDELFMQVGTVTYDPDASADEAGEFVETTDAGATRFMRHDILRGFVPDIERELLEWRDSVKVELKAAKAALEKAKEAREKAQTPEERATATARIKELSELVLILDKRQLSIKLIANSLYGCFGAKTSFAFCLDLADSVTRRGRAAILFARHLTLNVINRLTLEHPQAVEVAKFAGLQNTLVSLDAGKKVVEQLCVELAAARANTPKAATASATAAKRHASGGDIKKFFAMVNERQVSAPAAAAAAPPSASELMRIGCAYGDTDSLFISFWLGVDFNAVGRIAVLMAQFISISLHQRWATRNPHDNLYQFDVEKGFRVLLLLAKKRYVGLKYLWVKGAFVPADKDDEFAPSESGLETQRRDTTRLVSEHMTSVLSMLIDYRFAREEKLRRATSFIYHTMVAPLLDGSMQKHLIIQTRQLRKLPHEYLAKNGGVETSLPVHVQMALRAQRELGGPNAPGVPKSGDRIAFLVARGERGDKSSSRGVDPVHALDAGVEIDSRYYLDNHVSKAICRIFEPIIIGDRIDIPGGTESARTAERLAITHAAVFGARTDYRKPAYADAYVGVTREYNQRSKFVATNRLLRYTNRRTPTELDVNRLAVAGEPCACCATFHVGEVRGFVCSVCVATDRAGARRAAEMRLAHTRRELDILSTERAAIYEYCQRCARTERQPTAVITCDESGCDTFWNRRENLKALDEADARAASALRAMHSVYGGLLEASDDQVAHIEH